MSTDDLNLRRLALIGEARDEALRQADALVDEVADLLIAAGDAANYSLAAKLTGLSRTTLYRRVDARRAGTQPPTTKQAA